jgi:hypothetical protein
MNAIGGLYESAGSARQSRHHRNGEGVRGQHRQTYRYDSTPWCVLTVNYCLIASGVPGEIACGLLISVGTFTT